MSSPVSRLNTTLVRFAGRPWYPGLVAAVAAADYFVPGSPSNGLLAVSVLPRPDRWRILGISFAIGCALGALLLASLMGAFGESFVTWVSRSEGAELWQRIESFADAYGLLALAILAITPLPVRIAVAVLALAGTAPLLLAAIVLAGRLVVYPAVAWLAARAPRALRRLRPFAGMPEVPVPGEGRSVSACERPSGV